MTQYSVSQFHLNNVNCLHYSMNPEIEKYESKKVITTIERHVHNVLLNTDILQLCSIHRLQTNVEKETCKYKRDFVNQL